MLIEFVSTRFKNVLSYGNNITEFNYQSGLNLITAKNGNGKSSILEALTFSLFGKPYRKIKIDQLINDKNFSKLWTETIFIKGEDKYKIERGLKPAILKIFKTHKSKEFTSEDELDLKSHKALIQDEIDKIIGVNFALFRQIISLSILNNKPFLTLEAQEKRDILESIFNIKIFGKMLKTLKKNFSVLQSTLELKSRELDLIKESLRGLNEQIKSLKQAKRDFEDERDVNISKLGIRIRNLEKDLIEVEEKISKIDPEKLSVDSTNKQKLKNKIDDSLGEWIELKTTKDGILAQMKSPMSFPKLFDPEIVRSITELEKERDILNKKLVSVLSGKNNLKPNYVEKNLESCEVANKSITEFVTKLRIIRSDIEKIKAGKGVCEYCKQPISEDHKREEISKLQFRENEFVSLVSELRNNIEEDVQNHISKISKEIETESKNIERKVEEIDENIETLKTTHAAIIREKLRIELDRTEKRVVESAAEREINAKELEELEKAEKEIVELKNQFQILVIQRENVKTNLESVQKDLDKETTKKFAVDIEPLEKDFETKKINGAELNRVVKEMRRQINVSEVIKGILDEDGIKKYFFSRLIPKLNESINQFLDFFELPLNFSFDDTFEPTIKEMNRERSYYNFSGGERFRIDLSIVLSFMELNRMINSFHCNVLFFDELLDTGVDDDGMELVLEKLHDLVEQNGNACYIISQRQLESSVHIDNIIKVKKVNGFSKLV